MKKIIFFVFILLPLLNINAQWDFSISMGLDFKSAPYLRDYINSSFASPNDQLSSFSSSANFAGEVDFGLSNTFQLGIEYSFLIYSYNTAVGVGGIYKISYEHHRPSILGYYVVAGEGYKFKFGGGVGFRYISLSEEIFSKENYSANGLGFLLKADGNTMISGNFYALIGIDLRYDIPRELSNVNTNRKIVNFANGEAVNLNSLSVGIRLGVTYIL